MSSRLISLPVSFTIRSRSCRNAESEAEGSRGSFSLGPKHRGKLVVSTAMRQKQQATTHILGTRRPRIRLASVSARGPPFLH